MKSFPALILCLLISTGSAYGGSPQSQEALLTALDTVEAVKPTSPRKLLVFSLTHGYHHSSIPFGNEVLKKLGEHTGAFEAVVSNDVNLFEPENISQFDAICFFNTTGELFSPHKAKPKKNQNPKVFTPEEITQIEKKSQRLKASLMTHITSGKGFIGLHSATDSFYEWPEYGDMLGAYFAGHPWNHKTTVHLKVPEENLTHPLIQFLEGETLTFKEEIYQFQEPVTDAEILLKLDPHKNSFKKAKRKNKKNVPISWIKHHQKGRVFYSSLGHNKAIFTHPKVLQHYLNGIQWALGDFTGSTTPLK